MSRAVAQLLYEMTRLNAGNVELRDIQRELRPVCRVVPKKQRLYLVRDWAKKHVFGKAEVDINLLGDDLVTSLREAGHHVEVVRKTANEMADELALEEMRRFKRAQVEKRKQGQASDGAFPLATAREK